MAYLISLGILLVGCGGGQDTTTVQGKITYKGAPVTFGIINFQAAGAKPLGGDIKPDGTYEFDLPPGEYQVRIDSPPKMPEGYKEGDPPPKLGPRQAPPNYASYETSQLKATISDESPQQLDFPLQ